MFEMSINRAVDSVGLSPLLIYRFCGSQGPPTMTSTNNVMTVVFVSDRSIAMEGFSASYTTINGSAGNVVIILHHNAVATNIGT